MLIATTWQVSYAIGVAEPLSVTVFDYGTGTKTTTELMQIVKENFDLRPGRIVKDLKLKNPIFQQSATYGHFGEISAQGFSEPSFLNRIFFQVVKSSPGSSPRL